MSQHSLDCRGLKCPMPIVQISQTVKLLAEGVVLEVYADDLAFRLDVEAWCRRTGHALESFADDSDRGQVARIRIVE